MPLLLVVDEDQDSTVRNRSLNQDELKMAADNQIFVYEFRDGKVFMAEVSEQEATEEELEENEEAQSTFDIDWLPVRSVS